MPFSTIDEKNPLILASASPRRKRLLIQVGIPFRICVSRASEKIHAENPEALCRELAVRKAEEVALREKEAWVLGADTIVTIDNRVLGKPLNRDDAGKMLSLLSGRAHRVMTGFCILDPSGLTVHNEAVITTVRFKPLNRGEIEGYIRTGEPYGKAGAYAIQGLGSFMVESISGSYTSVVGLPICALIKALRSLGALSFFPL